MRRDPASAHDWDEISLLLLAEVVMRMALVLRSLPPGRSIPGRNTT